MSKAAKLMISDISEHQLAYGLSEGIEYRGRGGLARVSFPSVSFMKNREQLRDDSDQPFCAFSACQRRFCGDGHGPKRQVLANQFS